MLVLFTKLYLKNEVTKEDLKKLIIKWVTGSPHFHFENLEEELTKNGESGIESTEKMQKFFVTNYTDNSNDITIYKLNNQNDKTLWSTECAIVVNKNSKYITISLNCDIQEYHSQLPHKHKPYIIKLLVESGFCKSDGNLPVTDTPIYISDNNINDIANMMKTGEPYNLPIVYLSKDFNDYSVNPNRLSILLSGIAHVIVENSKEWSFKLRDLTDKKNAHSGYTGVYYPKTTRFDLFARNFYKEKEKQAITISCRVQQALVNYENPDEYTWNKIIHLQNKEKINTLKANGAATEKELQEFIDSFQPINDDLNEKVRSLNAQLDIYKNMAENLKQECSLLNSGNIDEFYLGEKNDLILSLLNQIKNKVDENTRCYELLDSILKANEYTEYGKHLFKQLKTILKQSEKLNTSSKSELKELGFDTIIDNGHPKLIFHENQKYKFPISGTPGSSRDGKNLYSDICKKLDIYKKFI